jgi:hypothetical protein
MALQQLRTQSKHDAGRRIADHDACWPVTACHCIDSTRTICKSLVTITTTHPDAVTKQQHFPCGEPFQVQPGAAAAAVNAFDIQLLLQPATWQ